MPAGRGCVAGARQVFDLDGTRLAARAAAVGLPVVVVEAPEAPPTGVRPGRLRVKQQAGAHLGVLNHVSSATAVSAFVTAARVVGVNLSGRATAVWSLAHYIRGASEVGAEIQAGLSRGRGHGPREGEGGASGDNVQAPTWWPPRTGGPHRRDDWGPARDAPAGNAHSRTEARPGHP